MKKTIRGGEVSRNVEKHVDTCQLKQELLCPEAAVQEVAGSTKTA
jgi:hypothetical protein